MIASKLPDAFLTRWKQFPLDQKILHICAEFSRTKSCLGFSAVDSANHALERALELMDFTVETEGGEARRSFLKEFLRLREMLAQYYLEPKKEVNELSRLWRSLLDLDPKVHNLKLEI